MKSEKITDERLEQLASGNAWICVQDDEGAVMARELRAYRKERKEAMPVFEVEISGEHWINAGPAKGVDFRTLPDGINTLYAAPPAHPVAVPEWTNEQCLEFLCTAFRHAEIKGDIEMDDIRLGVKMVNLVRASIMQEAK